MQKCEICDSTKNVRVKTKFGKILCDRHYKQMYRHGKILERTIYDPNEIITFETHSEMKLYNRECKEIARVLIDTEDVERVSEFKWSKTNNNYVISSGRNRVLLHRFLLEPKDGLDIDHINRNTLDNRKENLRIATHAENSRNIKKPTDNRTGIIGVHWDNARELWKAEIKKDGKNIFLGRFSDLQEAIVVRLRAEKELFKEFSPQQNLFEKYNI